ncbi:hypothetical protein LAZ67_9000057 [Cordylochernes scorpioides]|uniref:Uncharacterized protein n=1 Tax=Cordylochernes scorpioides TaxID=51811 RepID=A0ABY6KS62_9ARAC|nr:hypothetical protein LAZ67_9000057 [Cordylochernes scorpioides]
MLTSASLQVFRQTHAIDWVAGRLPLDEPPCGFDGSKCHIPPGSGWPMDITTLKMVSKNPFNRYGRLTSEDI